MRRWRAWWRRFAHDRLDWGYPTEVRGFDGLSVTSVCQFCGERLLMDSNGDWFHAW